jgi:hypothetical protein
MQCSPKSYRFIFLALTLLTVMAFTLGCGSSGSHNTVIRFVNASPNQASLNVLIDGVSVQSALANGGSSTNYLTVQPGSRHIQMQDPNTPQNLIDDTITVASGSSTTFIATNYIGLITPVVLTDDNSAPASGAFKLRLVNVAPNLGSADVYIQPGGTDINTVSPTTTNLAYTSASSYISTTAGSYEVVFTQAGFKGILAGGNSIAFTGGQVRTALVLNDPNGITFSEVLLPDSK